MSNETSRLPLGVRAPIVASIGVALAILLAAAPASMAIGGALFAAVGICCFIGALAGQPHPYAVSIGAGVVFAGTFFILAEALHPDHTHVSAWLGDLAIWIAISVAVGAAIAALVQLLRWIVRRVKP
jgi:hypothetical protein